MEYFKIAVDCFFAIWFVVGNVWIFGGHSSADQAPNLYRYSLSAALTFSMCLVKHFSREIIFQKFSHEASKNNQLFIQTKLNKIHK